MSELWATEESSAVAEHRCPSSRPQRANCAEFHWKKRKIIPNPYVCLSALCFGKANLVAQKACACFRPATQVKYTVLRNKKGLWKALGLDGRDQRGSCFFVAQTRFIRSPEPCGCDFEGHRHAQVTRRRRKGRLGGWVMYGDVFVLGQCPSPRGSLKNVSNGS